MRPDALASAIAEDRAAGLRPIAVVATVGTTSSTVGRSGRGDRGCRGRRGPLAARGRRVRRRGRDHPGAARAVPRLGAGGLDRRQPAQVALRAARRVAAAHPAPRRPARGVQPRSRVPADARPRAAGPRLQRVDAAARAAIPRAETVDAAALVRPGRPSPADRAPHRPGAGLRGLAGGSGRLRAARSGAVLHGLLPPPAAGASPAARTSPRWHATSTS